VVTGDVVDAAVGCGRLDAPVGGWVRHGGSRGDFTVVGCDESTDQWELRCHGDEWLTGDGDTATGINCTRGETAATVRGK